MDEDSWISKPQPEQAPGNMNSLHSSTSLISSAMSPNPADRDVDDVASVASVYTESGTVPGAARANLNRTERMWHSIRSKRVVRNVDINAVLDDEDAESARMAKKELLDIVTAMDVRGHLLLVTMGHHPCDWHDHSHINETNHEAVWRSVVPAKASVSFHPKEHPDRPTLMAELAEEADRTKREGMVLQKKVDHELTAKRASSPDKREDATDPKAVPKQRQRRKNKQADEIITDPFIAFGILDDQRTRDAKMQMQVRRCTLYPHMRPTCPNPDPNLALTRSLALNAFTASSGRYRESSTSSGGAGGRGSTRWRRGCERGEPRHCCLCCRRRIHRQCE